MGGSLLNGPVSFLLEDSRLNRWFNRWRCFQRRQWNGQAVKIAGCGVPVILPADFIALWSACFSAFVQPVNHTVGQQTLSGALIEIPMRSLSQVCFSVTELVAMVQDCAGAPFTEAITFFSLH